MWDGELRKVPGAGGVASGLAAWIVSLLTQFVRPQRLGMVTGADGTYIILQEPQTIVVPDVAFVRWDRLPGGIAPDGFVPVPPDLVVEVISLAQRAPDEPGKIAQKRELYRRAGVRLVWWVDPKRRTVAVFRNGHPVAELDEGDDLDGENVLPGFRLPVAEIFAEA